MDADSLLETLRARVPAATLESAPAVDSYITLLVSRDHIGDVLRTLRDDAACGFTLIEVTAADYLPRTPRFEVVYHLVRLGVSGSAQPGQAQPPARVRLKVAVPAEAASVPTATTLFPAANWLEREVWDLFGITFEGHPDLRRILLFDDWEGHPLRKDYPVQVRVPYRSTEPVQVSEQDFVANIERQRRATQESRRGQ